MPDAADSELIYYLRAYHCLKCK